MRRARLQQFSGKPDARADGPVTRRNRALMAAGALVVLPGSAAAKDICAALTGFVAASRETPAFESVRRSIAAGEMVVPGFRVGDCRVGAGEIGCEDISFNTRNFDDWPDPLSCPGVTAVTPRERPRGSRDRLHAYSLAGLRIEYGFSCRGCAGGPRSYFHIGFEGRGRREE